MIDGERMTIIILLFHSCYLITLFMIHRDGPYHFMEPGVFIICEQRDYHDHLALCLHVCSTGVNDRSAPTKNQRTT